MSPEEIQAHLDGDKDLQRSLARLRYLSAFEHADRVRSFLHGFYQQAETLKLEFDDGLKMEFVDKDGKTTTVVKNPWVIKVERQYTPV